MIQKPRASAVVGVEYVDSVMNPAPRRSLDAPAPCPLYVPPTDKHHDDLARV
jgi:hypothetical protein